MKKLFPLMLGMLFASASYAQTEWDALRFSQNQYFGTARFTGMGGAFNALGGDLSSIAINPAGGGVYRKGEFSFTNSLHSSSTSSDFMSRTNKDGNTEYAFQQIGVVGTITTGKPSDGLVNLNFGITYNKSNDFTFRSLIRGSGSSSSMMDYFAARANEFGITNDLESQLAYNSAIIDRADQTSPYYSLLNEGDLVNVRRQIDRTGYMGTYDFSISGNISNIIYFGASLGSVDFDYEENQLQSEDVNGITTNTSHFVRYDYRLKYYAHGSGINGKFGLIIRPFTHTEVPIIENLRFGAAIHTPTYLTVDDRLSGRITSTFMGEGDYDSNTSSTDWYRYHVRTPMKINLGAALSFGNQLSFQRGMISVDYDIIDYSTIHMESDDYFLDNENDNIKSSFKKAYNLRIGGEYQIGQWSFRAGYAKYGDPLETTHGEYLTSEAPILSSWSWSLGAGYRSRNSFFMDFAYSRSYWTSRSYLYDWNETIKSAQVKSTNELGSLVWTIGWKF